MDLIIELLDKAAFREAKRGYNTQDVDELIEQVKAEHERYSAEVRQREEAVDARVAEADRRAAEAIERAEATSDTDETLKRTLVLAQRTADAAIKEAEEQASRTLSSAQDQAARMLADAQEATARARADAESEARRAQDEARTRVLNELRELEAARDQFHLDVDALERHLEEQRNRVRTATRELQRLLDDPASLREAEVPALSDVAVPASSAPAVLAQPDPVPATPEEAAAAPVLDDDAWREPEATPSPAPSAAYATDAPAEESGDGPTTQEVDMLASRDADDDAYLAELRKAMTDESPLGPREEGDVDPLFDSGAEPSRSRFGRRR